MRVVERPAELALAPFHQTLLWHRRSAADPALAWLRARILEVGRAL